VDGGDGGTVVVVVGTEVVVVVVVELGPGAGDEWQPASTTRVVSAISVRNAVILAFS
jgi:hypothetical protein